MAKVDKSEKENINALTIAINKESDSYAFYKNAEKTVLFKPLKVLFNDLAKEEVKHKSLLITELKKLEGGAKKIESLTNGPEKSKDYGLSKYLAPQNVKPSMGYQDALIVAMKREESACELFGYLRTIITNKNLKNIFDSLYKWEVEHLRMLEEKYDEEILTDN